MVMADTPEEQEEQEVVIEDQGDADEPAEEVEADGGDAAETVVQEEVSSAENIVEPEIETDTVIKPPQNKERSTAPEDIEELHRFRQQRSQNEFEQKTIRQAQALEQRILDQGGDPQTARQVGRQHVVHQKELRDQEAKTLDLVNFVEGRQNAAMYFAQKYKLGSKQFFEDMHYLTKFRSPEEKELEAKRMSQIRSQAAEIRQLKQSKVAPQTFDNSQGAAEATTNQDRLLDAYLAWDRSEAAVKAARRLTLGS